MDLLLKNIILLQDTQLNKISSTNIVIQDGIITDIHKNANIPDPDLEIKGKKLVALPPPINSHTHLPMTLLRGISDDKVLEDWLQDIWKVESKLSAQMIKLGTELASLEMIKSGCAGSADHYFHQTIIGKVLEKAGLRGWLGATLLPEVFVEQGGIKEQLLEFERTRKLSKNSPLLTPVIAPHSPYTVDEETILQASEKASKYKIPIHIHISETREEVLKSEEKYGMPPVERLDRIKFFKEKLKTIMAHCTWITQREVEILGRYGATIAWCPVSSQKLAYGGVTPIPELREAGATVALGTDGTASNNTLDLWREMREGSNVISNDRWDPAVYTANQVLEDTCWSFRRKFCPESLIKVGNKADIVILDMSVPHLVPMHNIISNIVYAANGSDTHSLIVNGNPLMVNREVLTLNESNIIYKVEEQIHELR
ncbi:MAG: amidohydrolase [Candidatus Hodarchaeales archaeon]